MNAVEIINLSHSYETYSFLHGKKSNLVLDGININIKKGAKLGLMGLSGSGKSTIASIVMGLIKPTCGKIKFFEKDLELGTLKQRRDFYKIAQIVFQDPVGSTNPNFRVYDVLNEPLSYLSKLSKTQKDELINNTCNLLHIKSEYLYKKALSLSGGELGRVCLARALILKPKFLILDESLSSFDLLLQSQIIEFLNSLKDDMTFLFITHDFRLARSFCDEIILLDKGKIIEKIDRNDEFKSELGINLKSSIL